jgi:DNA-binding MarR family transcriptional regulator
MTSSRRRPTRPTGRHGEHAGVARVVVEVFRTNGRLLRWGERFSARYALTSARWQVLGALQLSGRALTAPQLGAVLGMSRQGTQKQLDKLLGEGLVASASNPQHRRSPLYELSARGRSTYQRIDQAWQRRASRWSASLTAADVEATCRVLRILHDQLRADRPVEETP